MGNPCEATFKIISITHASELPLAVGGSINEMCDFLENTPGSRISPCTTLNKYSLKATGEYQKAVTPIVRGTLATLTYVLKDMSGGSVSIACADMLAGSYGSNFSAQIHTHSQEFVYNSGSTENLAPITVG